MQGNEQLSYMFELKFKTETDMHLGGKIFQKIHLLVLCGLGFSASNTHLEFSVKDFLESFFVFLILVVCYF